MTASAEDMRAARLGVARVLEALGVRDYLYTLEEKNGSWVLTVECGCDGGWLRAAIAVDLPRLGASVRDGALRERLGAEWAPHLLACTGAARRAS